MWQYPICTLQEVRCRRENFQHKQRVLQEAIAEANLQAAQRRRAMLATNVLGWRHVTGVYKALAQRLAALQRLSLAGAMQQWRRYTLHKVSKALVFTVFNWVTRGPCS
jgi:hypothetical protein